MNRLANQERNNAIQKEQDLQDQLQSGFSQLHHVLKISIISVQNIIASESVLTTNSRQNVMLRHTDDTMSYQFESDLLKVLLIDCLANAYAYGGGRVWITYTMRDISGGHPALETNIFNNTKDGTVLTPEDVKGFFKGVGSTRSLYSTRIGLPSAHKIMNAIGGSIDLRHHDRDTVVCSLTVPVKKDGNPSPQPRKVSAQLMRSYTTDAKSFGLQIEGSMEGEKPPQRRIPRLSATEELKRPMAPTHIVASNPVMGVKQKSTAASTAAEHKDQEIAPEVFSCVVIEDDAFQREVYQLVLPKLVGSASKVLCLGATAAEVTAILENPQSLIGGKHPPDFIIVDYLLDYTSRGSEIYHGTEVAAVLRRANYGGIIALRSASLDDFRKLPSEQLDLFDEYEEKGNFDSLVKFVNQLMGIAMERRTENLDSNGTRRLSSDSDSFGSSPRDQGDKAGRINVEKGFEQNVTVVTSHHRNISFP